MSSSASTSTILLLRPTEPSDEQNLLRAHRSFTARDQSLLQFYEEGMSFAEYLALLDDHRRGLNMPEGYVPSTALLGVVDGEIVGRISIRHRLNDHLQRLGGHIGYIVLPESRRRGYATAMLRQALVIARDELGIDPVLVTCDDDNIGSIRVIERNGGVLENVVENRLLGIPKRRYWIGEQGSQHRD